LSDFWGIWLSIFFYSDFWATFGMSTSIFWSWVAKLSCLFFVRNFVLWIICKLFQLRRKFVKMLLFDFLMLRFIQFVFYQRKISIFILHLFIIFKIIGPNIDRCLSIWLALVQRSHFFIFFLLVSILFIFLRVMNQMVKRSVLVSVRGGIRLKRSFNWDLFLTLSLYFLCLFGLFFFLHFDLRYIHKEIYFVFVVLLS